MIVSSINSIIRKRKGNNGDKFCALDFITVYLFHEHSFINML